MRPGFTRHDGTNRALSYAVLTGKRAGGVVAARIFRPYVPNVVLEKDRLPVSFAD